MGLKVNILHNFDAIEDFYSARIQEIAGPAVKSAMNKTLISARKEALKLIHKKIKLNTRKKPKKVFAAQNVVLFKAQGTNAFNMEAAMAFSARPLSLINFVTGSAQPRRQAGITIKKRKPVKAQVMRGRKFTVKKAFIVKGKNNNYQIFKRSGNKALIKQGIPSLSHLIKKSLLEKVLVKMMHQKFQKNLEAQLKWRLDKAAKKASNSRMKKVT